MELDAAAWYRVGGDWMYATSAVALQAEKRGKEIEAGVERIREELTESTTRASVRGLQLPNGRVISLRNKLGPL